MLLANMAVAHHVTDKFSELAVLRHHPPPQTRMIDELVSSSPPSRFSYSVSATCIPAQSPRHLTACKYTTSIYIRIL